MSKFIKFVVNLILVLALLSTAALLVPSFVGFDMRVIENERVETNLKVGTVVYGKQTPAESIAVENKIFMVNADGSEYLYKVSAIDNATGEAVLTEAVNGTENLNLTLTSACVVKLTVPMLGYLAIAAGSTKGWIVIGLCALLLLLLYILAEVWRRDKADEELDQEIEAELDDEDELRREEKKAKKKAKKSARKEKRKRYADEDEDDDYAEYLERKKARKQAQKAGDIAIDDSETHTGEAPANPAQVVEAAREDIASSVADAIAENAEEEKTPAGTDLNEAETIDLDAMITRELAKAASEGMQENEKAMKTMDLSAAAGEETTPQTAAGTAAKEPEEAPAVKEIMIPVYTADELIRKAVIAGDEPAVLEDHDLGITLLDYSEVI